MPGYAELNWSQMPGVSLGGGEGGMIAVGIDSYIRASDISTGTSIVLLLSFTQGTSLSAFKLRAITIKIV